MDLVQAVRDGRAEVDWVTLQAQHEGYRLSMAVMKDALKVDGIRYPATAVQMQLIADELGAILPTPKILDLVWAEAGRRGIQFDPVINHHYPGHHSPTIVAVMPTADVSSLVDQKIAGRQTSGPIASVGKYWVLTNLLLVGKFATRRPNTQACNYGWHSSKAPRAGVTPGTKVWQTIGGAHNNQHVDPSQVVRLVHREAWLRKNGGALHSVDLRDVLQDSELAPLISHEGPLRIIRQPGTPNKKNSRIA